MTLRVASDRPSGERASVAIPGPAPTSGLEAPSSSSSRGPSVRIIRPVVTSLTTTVDHALIAATRAPSAENATASVSSGRATLPRRSPLAASQASNPSPRANV